MKNKYPNVLFLLFSIILSACIPNNHTSDSPSTLSPGSVTATAEALRNQTSVAESTLYPTSPLNKEIGQMPTLTWAPSPGEITASDSGTSFSIGITSRIAIVLSRADYPPENMKIACDPVDALGSISNLPIVTADNYAVRYEGIKPGQCIVSNGNFDVIINIVANP